MRRKDKPFVLYRRGPASFTIMPRGLKGWAQFGVWLGLAGALVVWLVKHVIAPNKGETLAETLFVFGFVMLGWMILGYWWMRAHAEEVDVVVLKRDRQRARRKRKED